MFRNLPPLNAVRTFESAARHLSFTLAAKELCVTQGAVSKQIKLLEQYLGVPVFLRLHQGLELTNEGAAFLPCAHKSLQVLKEGTAKLIASPCVNQTLSINVLPSLTISWLIPRLEEFKSLYPKLAVDVTIGDFPVDFSLHQFDVAIRSAIGPPVGVLAQKLMQEELCLVCSPKLAAELTTPEALNHVTLLQHSTRPGLWEYWAEQLGIDLRQDGMLRFEHFYMLSQAAVKGLGAALIPRFFIERELAEQLLVMPLNLEFVSPYSYYLITPKNQSQVFKVQVFNQWLQEQFGRRQKV